jgi:hypothetical protein
LQNYRHIQHQKLRPELPEKRKKDDPDLPTLTAFGWSVPGEARHGRVIHARAVFAKRIHADLQNKGVRCWFAPHDLRIGAEILDGIDAAIRLRDGVLLILSKHSSNSHWVEDQVTAAFEEERKRGEEVLFPAR